MDLHLTVLALALLAWLSFNLVIIGWIVLKLDREHRAGLDSLGVWERGHEVVAMAVSPEVRRVAEPSAQA